MGLILLEKVLTSAAAEPLSATSLMVQSVRVQVKRANANAMEWGAGVFTAGKGHELLAPVADTQLAGFAIEARGQNDLDLGSLYILGTSGEGVNIIAEVF